MRLSWFYAELVNACLQDNMNKRLQQKGQTRTALRQQLETQSKTFSNVEKDAQALLLKALHAGRKVTVRSCATQTITTKSSRHTVPMSGMSGSLSACIIAHLSLQHVSVIPSGQHAVGYRLSCCTLRHLSDILSCVRLMSGCDSTSLSRRHKH